MQPSSLNLLPTISKHLLPRRWQAFALWQDVLHRVAGRVGRLLGAVVLEAAETPGIMYSTLGADGRYRDLLYASSGVSLRQREGAALRMKGNEVFKVAVKMFENLVDDVVEKNNLETGQIDWLIPHQANIRIISATAKRLDLPMERVILTVREHGNTSAASVPMALDTAIRDGRIKRGDLLMLKALGEGIKWGESLRRFCPSAVAADWRSYS